MIYQSACRTVTVRIEVTGGAFDGVTGEERKRAFQGLVQFAVALAGSKKVALAILKSEMVNAFNICLRRINGLEKEYKGLEEGSDSTENSGESREEGWPKD